LGRCRPKEVELGKKKASSSSSLATATASPALATPASPPLTDQQERYEVLRRLQTNSNYGAGGKEILPPSFSSMSKKPSNQFSWRHDDTLHVKSSERRTPSSDTSSTPPPLFNHVDSPLRRRSLESHWENEAIPAGPPSQAHARAVSTSSAASSTTSTSASAVMLSEETNPIVQEAILVGEDYHLDDEEVFEAIPITNLEAERTTSVGENQLAASTWLMSVESVESKPVIPGWYFAVGDASLSWVQFSSTHEASIEKAWMDGVSKTLMLFNGTKGDDKKIDLNRMYQKNRGGVRKPIIRIADSNEGKVDEVSELAILFLF